MRRILIVEDDATIASLLSENLLRWDFEARCVRDFERVLDEFQSFDPQLVLMDISLPFFNGYYWCAEIRKISRLPIIFLSSHSENMDIVMAVNMGADDYITKPFSMEVLVAKIQAMLRRAYGFSVKPPPLSVGGATLNACDGTLEINGAPLALTRNEARIMAELMQNAGNIVSREQLMRRLWDDESFIDDNTLTVNINRLRKKLAEAGLEGFIETRKRQGYMVHDSIRD